MADYTDNALLSSIKAMEQMVLPAVNPADPLATEQLRLTAGMLKFLRGRLEHGYPRQLFELDHYLGMADALAQEARQLSSEEIAERLTAAQAQARALQAMRAPKASELKNATAALASAVAAVARAAGQADTALRRQIEKKVMEGSRRWVELQRTWVAPLGFDLRPDELPALEQLLYER